MRFFQRSTNYILLFSVLLCVAVLAMESVGASNAQTPAIASAGDSSAANPEAKARVEKFMTGPSVFVQNDGQWPDTTIKFALDGLGANVGITDKGPKFQLFRQSSSKTSDHTDRTDPSDPTDPPHASRSSSEMLEFRLVFDGSASTPIPVGRGKSERTFNYMLGDVANHREGVPSFNAVWYENLYPGIALELTGKRTGLKYNFHVAPGADPRAIRLRYEGVEKLSLTSEGALEIHLAPEWQPLTDGAPYLYQEINGEKKAIAGRFILFDGNTYGFEITGHYDTTLPVVIDPEVAWSSYLGGTGIECGYGIAVDGNGNCYATGDTSSSGWVSGGFDTTQNGSYDGYVVKLNASGVHQWSTYLGGTDLERGYGIAVDGNGNCYATGDTSSSGWVSGGWDTTLEGVVPDGYVVKLDPDGAHQWSSYLGSWDSDSGRSIAVDGSGSCYITGTTDSLDWVSGGFDTSWNGNSDGFVVKLDTSGVHQWSTYLGGTNSDQGLGIAVDDDGGCYATGGTNSSGWVNGGFDTSWNGNSDGFVVKLDTSGVHQWSTYLGGTNSDQGSGIAVELSGNCYATGQTASSGWISYGWDTTYGGSTDGYVVKLNTAGQYQWSSYLGDTSNDYGYGISADGGGNSYITGATTSSGWVSGGWDNIYNGGVGVGDAYVVKLNTSGGHEWSSYLGGTSDDRGWGIAVDGSGQCYVTGETLSTGWVFGGWDTVLGETGASLDAFVSKLQQEPGNLQVTLTPPEAVAAGAQWRRAGTAIWINSGDSETGIATGFYSIEFKDLFGYMPPDVHMVWVPSGGTAQDTGVYTAVSTDMEWSSYLGDTGYDVGYGIAVDASGNCYAAGYTDSPGWVSGGWDTTQNGSTDAYVVKLNTTGAHQWSTYLGGANNDNGYGIAVDEDGNCFVIGDTQSSGWVNLGWNTALDGVVDGFVVKLNAAGQHQWSTFLGGSSFDYGYGIAADLAGNCYATGMTQSSGWVSGGYDTSQNGAMDGFVVKLNPAGQHQWSTYLGGATADYGYSIAVDFSENCYVTGQTDSSDWVSDGFDTTQNGNYDAYVVKLNISGQHQWSTYAGGTGYENGKSIAVDRSGTYCCITGQTESSSGFISNGWDTLYGGSTDGYVMKLSSAGAYQWSSYLGGTGNDYGIGITVDGCENCYVTGTTNSSGWVSGGGDTAQNGNYDAYVVKLNWLGAHQWSSYLGGTEADTGFNIAVDTGGNCYVTGYTNSSGWVIGGWITTYGGGTDAYVAKIQQETGSLQVTLTPTDAVAAGAQWRRVGTITWINNGVTETGVVPGLWDIEFKDLIGYAPPDIRTVEVTAGGTAQETGEYTVVTVDLEWSTYMGGSDSDYGCGIAVDSSGNCYAAGYTLSSGWVSGGHDTIHNGSTDGYVVKLNTSGVHQWSTYVGGTNDDSCLGIAVDSSGNCYATGYTWSSAWASGGFDTTHNGSADGFVLKLNTSGAHQWSTYLGGTLEDNGYGIAADSSGNCYATGYTFSSGWASGGWDTSYAGGPYDGFVVKLSTLGAHQWSTYLGGANNDFGYGIAVDNSGTCYATGQTYSSGWAIGGFDTSANGAGDAYVVKFNTLGAHQWSTYLGGTSDEVGYGIAVDSGGNAYATGYTFSSGWVSGGWDNTLGGSTDGYVVKITMSGAFQWSTYLGGASNDRGYAIAVDGASNCVVTGETWSSGWVNGGGDTTQNGAIDGYVVKLNTSGVHQWSTYLGGTNDDGGCGIAMDPSGNCYVTGYTLSSGWVSGGWSASYGGNTDAFVVKILQILPNAAPTNPGATAIGTNTITWTWTDASTNETGFKVYDDPGTADPVTLRITTEADVQSWQHNGLSPNTQHAFQVAATNVVGDSVKTATITAWTLAARPLLPAITNLCSRSFDVTLNPGDTNPVGTEYAISVIIVSTGTVMWVQLDGSLGIASVFQTMPDWGTITVTGLTPTQFYLVFAVARNGAGVNSQDGMITPETTLEGVPPTATLSSTAGDPVNGAITVNVTLSENSTTFEEDNITVVNAIVNDFTGSDAAYSFTLTPTLSIPGTFSCVVLAGAFSDLACNPIEMDSNTLSRNYDRWPPTGSMLINGGAEYTNALAVTLAVSADDGSGSGVADMHFSNNTITWSPWEPYASIKAWNLLSGDGPKSVYVAVRDEAGNVSSPVFSDAITYDGTPPSCVFLINGGNAATNFPEVTLTVNAADSGSGLLDMRFSNDAVTWSPWGPCALEKSWPLIEGFGSKTVYATFRDKAGNVSEECSDTVVLVTTGTMVNPPMAMEGDEVLIHISVLDLLFEPPAVTVNGHLAVYMGGKDAEYLYSYTVLDPIQDPLGPAEIVITCVDLHLNLEVFTNNDALTIIAKNTVPLATLPMLAGLSIACAVAGVRILRRKK